jgi:uncharacterized repeat protein (TIGR03987 family)
MVRAAVLLMISALSCYTVGVWGARFSARLRPWQVGLFWLGLFADVTGTELMRRLAGGFRWGLHSATGAAALTLMVINAVWATRVLLRRDERALTTYSRVATLIWLIWLVPFVSGMLLARGSGR